MRSNYKKLGQFIKEVSIKNKDLSVELLLGVSITKQFIPSIANTFGTDMSKYKVVEHHQFAYGPVTSRNGEKISVALLGEEKCIVSTSYTVFEIVDIEQLDPEYLMMWFRRSEFDRYARYMSHGTVRELFGWQEMCDVELPVPSIEKQREIVREYNVVNDRISLNEKLTQKLESTAQTIYKQWFADFEFPISKEYAESIGKPELEGKPYKSSGGEMVFAPEVEKNIPKGWKPKTLSVFCKDMKNGATPKRDMKEYWDSSDIPWIKTGEIKNNIIVSAEEYISELGYKKSSTHLLPKNTVLMALYGATASQLSILKFPATTNQACCGMQCYTEQDTAYLYYRLLSEQEEIKNMAIGGAQANLSKALIEKFHIFEPEVDSSLKFIFKVFIDNKTVAKKREVTLHQLRELLLYRMTNLD